jgi:hypothetical protein
MAVPKEKSCSTFMVTQVPALGQDSWPIRQQRADIRPIGIDRPGMGLSSFKAGRTF